MSIIHISTLSELITALTSGDNDIYIDNDIDCNDSPFTSSTLCQGCNVYGQGHTLYNLQTFSNISIFTTVSGKICHWYDTNFDNVYAGSTSIVFSSNHSNGSHEMILENCTIQGRWNSLIGRATLKKCAVTGYGRLSAQVSYGHLYAEYCYFDITYTFSMGTYLSYYGTNIENCYFTGTIDMENATNGTNIISWNNFTPVNCVFNMEIKANAAHSYKWGNALNSTLSLYNSSKIDSNITLSQTSSTFIGLSDTDLKDVSAVAATGFPIVV